ncbi:MAG: ribonuclease R [Candidatus Spyradocola sp.]|jgi:ribonuclease R
METQGLIQCKEKIEALLAQGPQRAAQIAEAMEMQESALLPILDAMVEEGRLVQTRKERYALPETLGMIRGQLHGNARGFGFVVPENGEQDLFIPPDRMGGALHGDTVFARVTNAERREGEIARVLAHANDVIVGTFERDGDATYVVPDEKRISMDVYVSRSDRGSARPDDKVVVRVTQWPSRGRNPRGRVIENLGNKDDIGTDIKSLIRQHRLDEDFPQSVLGAAAQLPDSVQESDLAGRRDLRALNTFTIDGATAKDFDDAVSIEDIPSGWRLGVHIADVSHYVVDGSLLDREAFKRATSVYLLDRVLPMLPETLSNGLCSLNPDVDRLTFTCSMDIDPEGRVLSYDIYPSVIHSHARLVYEDVTRLLETGEETGFAPEVARDLRRMGKLAETLSAVRRARGALDLDIDEAVITLDERGVPTSIEREERGIANSMIEEFMLKANECVAEFARLHQIPILYRVHEDPDPEKIQAFDAFLINLGYRIRTSKGKVHPKALQAVLDKAKGKPEEGLISRLMLRSLQKARYCPQPLGHFGLAAPDYCHFTSPIRRYPDLFVHRALHLYLAGKSTARMAKRAEEYAQHCSEKERQAMEAERDVDDLKKAQYMLGHIGEVYEGVISSVTSFGLFVELPNTVEGLIHISNLDDDYYTFVEKSYMLLGERKKKVYRLGDPIRIVVTAVDMSTRRVDFAVDEDRESGYTEEAKPAVPKDADGKSGKKDKKGKKPPKRREKGERKS